MYDTASSSWLPRVEAPAFHEHTQEMFQALSQVPPEPACRKRGRPPRLSCWHLWLGLLLGLLQGMRCQRDLWRLIISEAVGPFAPVILTDEAIYRRLAQEGIQVFERLWTEVSRLLALRLAPYAQTTLAPFASLVVALDDTTLDTMARRLLCQRDLPAGSSLLLPGRIASLFDVRLHQWRDFRFIADPHENERTHARSLLATLPLGSLILHDRGFFSFPWFDELTTRGYWWVSRTREKVRLIPLHIFYQHGSTFDGLVWMGEGSNQAAHAVRLVCFVLEGKHYRYVTNVLDPFQLTLPQIMQLYRRRWDIELTFRLLKEDLGLNLIWSSKLAVVQLQCLACLILAQLLHGFRLELAAHAEVDLFEVSMPLLLKALPRLMRRRLPLLETLLISGRQAGIIRPCSRQTDLPVCPPCWMIALPPANLLLVRPARYSHRPDGKRQKAAASDSSKPPQPI